MTLIQRLEKEGFFLTSTGGGCEAYCKNFSDGSYILLTDSDGDGVDNIEDTMIMGFYDSEGDPVFTCGNELVF